MRVDVEALVTGALSLQPSWAVEDVKLNVPGKRTCERAPRLTVLFVTGYAEQAAARTAFLGPRMHMITKPSAIGSKWCAKSMAFFEDRVDCRGAAEWLELLVVKCDDATDTVGAMPQDQNSACIRNATMFTGPRSLLYAGWTMRSRSNPTEIGRAHV